MKKIIAFIFGVALLSTLSAFAKTYTNNVGFGVTFPQFNEYKVTDTGSFKDSKFDSTTGGLDVQYLGYFDFGLSFKVNFDLTWGTLKMDYGNGNKADENDPAIQCGFRLGVGYGLVRTEHVYFGLFFFLGEEAIASINKNGGYTNTFTGTAVSFGLEPALIFTPNKSFSLYVNCGVGYALAKKMKIESKPESGDTTTKTVDCAGTFALYPTAGICWKF